LLVPPYGGMDVYFAKTFLRFRLKDTYFAGAGSTLRSLTRAF
jgi:hypothetical protein